METKVKRTLNLKVPVWLLIIIALLVVALIVVIPMVKREKTSAEVITISTLERIVNVSELSTYTAVYNGVAEVPDSKNPEEVDYYVSYEAKVYAGIDFTQTDISKNEETKEIIVTLPQVHITKVDVDITSLDFIFYDDKTNTSTVIEEAYKACEEDAFQDGEQQAICDLAKENAKNTVVALVEPFVESMGEEYTLNVV